jgi:beta-glucanase (GH16 family)
MSSQQLGGIAAPRILALFGLVLSISGCGGGGGGSSPAPALQDTAQQVSTTSSPAPGPAPAPAAANVAVADIGYTVDASELLTNTDFSAGMSGWTVNNTSLVTNPVRTGNAMSVGYDALYNLPATKLEAGKSYTLRVSAKNLNATGWIEIALIFRNGNGAEKYRVYKTEIRGTTLQDYVVEFTAPPYVGKAQISLATGNGARGLINTVSLKMRSALPQTEAIASTANSYVPTGYSLAFNDEFNGTELNRKKWFTRYIYGSGTSDHLNDEKQLYRDNDNHVVAGGVLNLIARYKPWGSPWGVDYESGMIRSDWTARYGYFEARVKMPGGLGVWPAFWLNSDVSSSGRLGWPPEIDIFEFVNNGVEDKVNMIHGGVVTNSSMSPSQLLYADPAYNSQWGAYYAPFNFNEGWHTIGAEWTDDRVTMFIDGKKIFTRSYKWEYEAGVPAGPAHVLLNLAVGGSWAGRHGIDPSFPQTFQIDWVRAYKKNP